MAATLRTIDATVAEDGSVLLAEPVEGPAKAVLTVLIDDELVPNAATIEAMQESVADLPRFQSVEDLMQELED